MRITSIPAAVAVSAILLLSPVRASAAPWFIQEGFLFCYPDARAGYGIYIVLPPTTVSPTYLVWIPEVHHWDPSGTYLGAGYGGPFYFIPSNPDVSGSGGYYVTLEGDTKFVGLMWLRGWVLVRHWIYDFQTGQWTVQQSPHCGAF